MELLEWFLLLASVGIVQFTVAVAIVGLAWSPVAAFVSIKNNGLGIKGKLIYGSTSAVYSMLFILPWIYFRSVSRGKQKPRDFVLLAWALTYISAIGFVSISRFFPLTIDALLILIVVLLMGAASCVITGFFILNRRVVNFSNFHQSLPHYIFAAPFLALYVGAITAICLFYFFSRRSSLYL